MAMTPQKPPASKPNPLHGEPPKEEFAMPGKSPEPDMATAVKADESHLSDNTLAERNAGKQALGAQNERTKAEQEAGAAIIAKHPQPKAPPPAGSE